MRETLSWFAPPVFPENETKTRHASLLNLILVTMIAGGLVLFFANQQSGNTPPLLNALNGTTVIVCLALSGWMRRGHVQAASVVSIGLGWVLVTIGAAMLGTIRTPTTALYLALILMAGMLFDMRGVAMTSGLSSLAVAGLIWAERTGLLPRADYSVTITQWISYTALFGFAGALSVVGLNPVRQALDRADKEIAERKRTEVALRLSEERFAKAFRANPAAMGISRLADGKIIDVNDNYEHLTGYSRAEIIGQTAFQLRLFADPAERTRVTQLLREQGSVHHQESTLRTKSGELRNAWVSLEMIELESDPCILAIYYDVTERKRAENALKESEAKYRLLFENMDEAFSLNEIITDASGHAIDFRILDVNSAYERHTGLKPQDCIGKTMREIMPQADPQPIATFGAVALSGEPLTIEYSSKTFNRFFHVRAFCPQFGRFATIFEDITVQKRAEVQLAALAARNQTLLETASDGIHILDDRGGVVEVNAAFCAMLGYTREEMLRLNVEDWDARWHGEELVAKVREAIDSPAVFETRYRCKNGSLREVEINAAGITLEGRRYLYASARDNSERKKMEQALLASEQYARSIIDCSLDMIITTDPDRKIVEFNRAAQEVFGYAPEEIIGRPASVLYARPEEGEAIRRAMRAEGKFTGEVSNRRKSGDVFVSLLSASVLRGAGGENYGVVGMSRDIMPLKVMQAHLRESEEHYRALFEQLPIPAFTKDREGRYISSNPENLKYWAVTPVGHTDEELLAPEIAAAIQAGDRRVLESGKMVAIEDHLRTPLGERDFLSHKIPLRDLDGKIIGVLGASLDITERKQAEETLAKVSQQLRSIIESSGDVIAMMDAEYRYVLFNTAFHHEFIKIFGRDLKPGASLPEALSHLPQDLADAMNYWKRALAGEDFIVEQQFGDMALERNWYELHFSPIRDQAGRVVSAVHVVRNVTQRKWADDELRESEERFRAFFEQTAVGVAQVSANGHFISVNEQLCSIVGYPEKELVDLTFQQITHPDDKENSIDKMRKMLNGELDTFTADKRYIRKDGATIWVGISTSAVRDSKRRFKYFITIVEDLTERRQLERDLKTQRDFVTQVINTLGQGLTVTDADRNFILVNPAYAKFVGCEPEDLIGKRAKDFTLGDDQSIFDQARAARARGEITTYENRLVRADGTIVPVLITGSPRWVDGKVAGTIALITDLTKLKQAEEAVHFERNLLRTVIDTIPDQVFAKDQDSRFVINNRADALRMGVAEPDTLVGKCDLDFYPLDIAAGYRADDQYVIMTRQSTSHEQPVQDPDGKPCWMRTTKVPWRDQNGQVVGVVGISTDITERKELEQQIERSNKRLLDQVEQLNQLQVQLREQAMRDPLTQLFNRRYLNETLPREVARAHRQREPISIVMLDLDHFKRVNDSLGHPAGDVVLQSVARLIQSQLRTSDIVCRYGGEEILCLLLDTAEEIAFQRAEKLRLAISNMPIGSPDANIRITASLGVATLLPDDADIERALKAADAAMYRAKEAGRNLVVVDHNLG